MWSLNTLIYLLFCKTRYLIHHSLKITGHGWQHKPNLFINVHSHIKNMVDKENKKQTLILKVDTVQYDAIYCFCQLINSFSQAVYHQWKSLTSFPGIPGGPVAPAAPGEPLLPLSPRGPAGPMIPSGPLEPKPKPPPGGPGRPRSPGGPLCPATPASPWRGSKEQLWFTTPVILGQLSRATQWSL